MRRWRHVRGSEMNSEFFFRLAWSFLKTLSCSPTLFFCWNLFSCFKILRENSFRKIIKSLLKFCWFFLLIIKLNFLLTFSFLLLLLPAPSNFIFQTFFFIGINLVIGCYIVMMLGKKKKRKEDVCLILLSLRVQKVFDTAKKKSERLFESCSFSRYCFSFIAKVELLLWKPFFLHVKWLDMI